MVDLVGSKNSARIFTDNVDSATIGQVKKLLEQDCVVGSQIRIMPDEHCGKGCVIGTTMTLKDKVIPNLVGCDIGCGMLAVKLRNKTIDLPALDSVIHKYIPSGMNIHDSVKAESNVDQIYADVNVERALLSLGSLGGGNHFIEVDKDSKGFLWLVIHTGSRHLGIEVCDYYQNLGYAKLKDKHNGGSFKELSEELIKKLKVEGREREISQKLAELKAKFNATQIEIPQAFAYVEGEDFKNYIHDMRLAQEHASINRGTIAKIIMKKAKLKELERFETVHNYIDCDNMILRKGAISAQLGERVLIPMNMRDGSLICSGRGNADWNFSAPHGAGRVLSRTQAFNSLSMSDYKESMKGIYTSCVSRGTLDEAPMVYKPAKEIMDNIKDTVHIIDVIKPIYNYKAETEVTKK